MIEQWKTIEGFEDYQVSNLGKVKSFKVCKQGKLMKTSKKRKGGHLRLVLHNDNTRYPVEIQTLVALMFIGPRPEGNVVRHLDGNPENNCVTNLKYGTHKENHADAVKHGWKVDSYLLDEQVELITIMRSLGYKAKELAEMFGVSIDLMYKKFKRMNYTCSQ